MKTGRSLQEIAAELERQKEVRTDYLAPQGAITAKVIGTKMDDSGPTDDQPRQEVVLDGFNGRQLAIQPYAHGQLADHLGIPKRYYDRMMVEQPQLLADNMNTWLHSDPANQRMVRTLDGRVRAVLSPKFRPLDNFELANAVLPTLLKRNVQIVSAELTETRMYIKGILPDLSDELPEGMAWGDGGHRLVGHEGRIVAAIVISNSEVGAGTLRVEPSVFTTFCTNLAIMAKAAMKKYHVGRAFDADDDFNVYRDETRAADDKAFWMKVVDVTQAAFAEDIWKAAVESIRNAGRNPIVNTDLPQVVEVAVKRLALPPATGGSILTHLAAGGDLTQWGLSSAITRAANDLDDYETATSLERIGGQVLALPDRDWNAIAAAAA